MRPWILTALIALVYGGLHLLWYWSTPLGVAPVLDERENLELAREIATGTLPAEPFYRAMGYPWVLSVFPKLGVPATVQPFAATALGLILQAVNTALVALIALRLFNSHVAAWLAGLVHALNPALVHYATQILDGTLANTFFCLGLLSLIPANDSESTPSPAPEKLSVSVRAMPLMVSGMSWSLAALVRPQFIVLLPILPLGWWLTHGRITPGRNLTIIVLGLLAAVLPWFIQGTVQKNISGDFRLMPTQGTYNLWAANRPGADGRYFIQTVHLPAGVRHLNPTREESLLLYQRETGQVPASMDQVNAHWSARLRATLLGDPVAWLGLMARKTYYLFNDFDAYNNKTYAFHQSRSPWLAANPLDWGVVFIAGVAGFSALVAYRPRMAGVLGGILVIVAAGIALTFVSGRFRLPLTALFCILGGGLVRFSCIPKSRRWLTAGGMVAVAALTFSNFAEARDTRTFLQDHLLLAASAVEAGDDSLAWTEAGAALVMAPVHPDALAWRVTAGFNLLGQKKLSPEEERRWQQAAATLLSTVPLEAVPPSLIAIAGLARWRAGELAAAEALWREQAETRHESAAYAALQLAGLAVTVPPKPTTSPDPFTTLLMAVKSPTPDARAQALRARAHFLFHPTPVPPR